MGTIVDFLPKIGTKYPKYFLFLLRSVPELSYIPGIQIQDKLYHMIMKLKFEIEFEIYIVLNKAQPLYTMKIYK